MLLKCNCDRDNFLCKCDVFITCVDTLFPLCITFCIFPALVFCNIDVTLSCSCWDHLEQLVIVLEEGKCFCVIHLFLSYFPLEMPNYILYLSWNRACLVFVDHFRIVYSCLVYSCIMNINALQEFFCAFFLYMYYYNF